MNDAFKGFVNAMFRPGLRERLYLHIGWVAFQRTKMGLDRPHFGEVQ